MKKDLKNLNKLQFDVTQNNATEKPFDNLYWNNKEEGIYVDIVSGEPLFSSQHKYDSKTGWPSFYQILEPDNIIKKIDNKLLAPRTEIRSKHADSHLGHVFDDGPAPSYQRYCLNSAALRFIPKDKLESMGYKKYLNLFYQEAYFAGGCFWCLEADFIKINGVKLVESGYIGGSVKNPSYEQVCSGLTGHVEAIKITFDAQIISYDNLLKIFWLNIDPRIKDRQFCDIGTQYNTAIFFINLEQEQAISKSIDWLKNNFNIIPKTQISHIANFYTAEEYHQKYAEKNPEEYNNYRKACMRDGILDELYGDERKKILGLFKK